MRTSLVPVQVGDVVERSLAHADPLAAHDVVDVHEAVHRRHRQVLSRAWGEPHSGEEIHSVVSEALSTTGGTLLGHTLGLPLPGH